MALVLKDRVRETSISVGTSAITLLGAVTGYQTFGASVGSGNTCYYTIYNQGTNEWEVGLGTVGSGTLSRDTVLSSSNSNALVDFTAGTKDVFVTYPSEKAVYLNASGAITPTALTVTSLTDSGLTSGRVTYAGTGGLLVDSANLTFNGTTLTSTGFSGPLNGTVGATTPAAGTFTSLTDSGNLTFTGTGNRITGDFSNATVASRVAIQTSTTNGVTGLILLPNGTSVNSNIALFNNSDPSNASFIGMSTAIGSDARIQSGQVGSGTFLPMTFLTGGSERIRIDTSGNVGIGTSSIGERLTVRQDQNAQSRITISNQDSGASAESSLRIACFGGSWDISNGSVAKNSNALTFSQAGGSERMRIDSAGNVGIGTSSPSAKLQTEVSAAAGTTNQMVKLQSASAVDNVNLRIGAAPYTGTTQANIDFNINAGTNFNSFMTFGTSAGAGTTERMRIDSSGNVGIGTSSPGSSTKLNVVGRGLFTSGSYDPGDGTASGVSISYDTSNNVGIVGAVQTGVTEREMRLRGNLLTFYTNGANERMRIDSSGNIFIGATSGAFSIPKGISLLGGNGTGQFGCNTSDYDVIGMYRNGFTGHMISFWYNSSSSGSASGGAQVGGIVITASTTAYNTSSDYRLKENIAPMVGALETVAQLKPVTYNWKADGSDGQGFIAHELQAVVPDAVTGEKDAVDKDGKPVYQGIDTSFLVATLTAAIQELNAKVEALEAQLNKE